LEDLHGRDLSNVEEPHVSAITMVRAGILRSAIGAIMACLDRDDWRGNRAGVGQIIELLNDKSVAQSLPEDKRKVVALDVALQHAKTDFDSLLQSDMFQRGRRLRDDAIAHILIRDDRPPDLTYQTIYALCVRAEELVSQLYAVCDRGTPQFVDQKLATSDKARLFWDTYFKGMGSD
jgi:hypothetical protein